MEVVTRSGLTPSSVSLINLRTVASIKLGSPHAALDTAVHNIDCINTSQLVNEILELEAELASLRGDVFVPPPDDVVNAVD